MFYCTIEIKHDSLAEASMEDFGKGSCCGMARGDGLELKYEEDFLE